MSTLKSPPDDINNRPNRVKKIRSYEEEEVDQPLPSKKKKKLSSGKQQQADTTVKQKKISFNDTKTSGAHPEDVSIQSLIKRPRGRPPLAGSIKIKPTHSVAAKSATSVQSVASSSGAGSALRASTSNVAPFTAPPLKQFVPQFQLVQPTTVEPAKAVRPTSAQVATGVLRKLMTSNPLSTVELMKSIPEAPRDLVQSVVDVLQVLGVVMAVKLKEAVVSDSPLGPATSTSVNLYCLTGYARAQSAVELAAIVQDTAKKVEKHRNTKLRMKQLHELVSREGMTSAERLAALRNLIDTFLAREPDLWDDPLYRSVIEQTGNTFQLATAKKGR